MARPCQSRWIVFTFEFCIASGLRSTLLKKEERRWMTRNFSPFQQVLVQFRFLWQFWIFFWQWCSDARDEGWSSPDVRTMLVSMYSVLSVESASLCPWVFWSLYSVRSVEVLHIWNNTTCEKVLQYQVQVRIVQVFSEKCRSTVPFSAYRAHTYFVLCTIRK